MQVVKQNILYSIHFVLLCMDVNYGLVGKNVAYLVCHITRH